MGIGSNRDISWISCLIKIPEMIYLIVISTTMLNIDGKVFWFLNLCSIVPKLWCMCLYVWIINDKGKRLAHSCLPIFLMLDTAVAFMYFFESLL